MNFLDRSNTIYRTLHVNSMWLAFTTMSVSPMVYTVISVFSQVASAGCHSRKDAACFLALGPYTIPGVPSSATLPHNTIRIVCIGLLGPRSMYTKWAALTVPIALPTSCC